MKKLLCVLFALGILFSFAACEKEENRTISLLTKETVYASDGSIGAEYTYEYDDRGNLTKAVYPRGQMTEIYEYSYDENGYLVKRSVTYDLGGEVGNPLETLYEYTFDKKGNPESCTITGSGKEPYTCQFETDNRGNITRAEYIVAIGYGDAGAKTWQEYQYDKDRLVKESFFRVIPQSEMEHSTTCMEYTYSYDATGKLKTVTMSQGREIHSPEKTVRPKLMEAHRWEFDRDGEGLVAQISIDGKPLPFTKLPEGFCVPETVADWTFDSKGNVTEAAGHTYEYKEVELSAVDAQRYETRAAFCQETMGMLSGISYLRMRCLPTYDAMREGQFYYYLIPNPLV